MWVGSFFFTACPAICWKLNQTLAAWQESHPNSPVKFVSITCDPESDTPEVLKRYAEQFHADPRRWTFLTGPMDTISRIGNESFKVSVERGTHSDRGFVVDREGKVRGRFRLTEPDQLAKLKKLLGELDNESRSDAEASTDNAAPDKSADQPLDGKQGVGSSTGATSVESVADAKAQRTPRTQRTRGRPADGNRPAGALVPMAIHPLATTNAVLNATATLLLIVGYLLIKQHRETAHKWVMLSAFGVSIAFLACYVLYHVKVGHVEFRGTGWSRPVYLTILLTHVILAATVPFLAAITIYRGLKDQRQRHRRIARVTYPIWLYVSITGVVIYAMLYHLFPGPG